MMMIYINRDCIFKDNVDYLLLYRENLVQTKSNLDNLTLI